MAAAGSESIHLGNGREDDGEERPELAELLAPAAVDGEGCDARGLEPQRKFDRLLHAREDPHLRRDRYSETVHEGLDDRHGAVGILHEECAVATHARAALRAALVEL